MRPQTILWQYNHPSLSTNCKFDSLPTSLSQEVAQKELKAQTPFLWFFMITLGCQSRRLPQMWVLLPIQKSPPMS
jgi:hypothetical protein